MQGQFRQDGRLCDNRPVPDFTPFEGNPDFILSLARGLAIIEAFGDHPDGVTVADVAARTALSRAAVRRGLLTLEMLGYACHTGPVYKLSSRILRLGFSFLSSNSLATLALPILEELRDTIQESSSLSILEGGEIVYIARSGTNRVMSVGLAVGSRLPAYCTSMGRVLLAALPDPEVAAALGRLPLPRRTPKSIVNRTTLKAELARVREQGFSLVSEELELGLRSLAVPVITRSGKLVAAMNAGVHASRISTEVMLKKFLPALKAAAHRLGQSLP
jgi:IclR family pca regulon transcriptional regulator